MAIQNNNTSPYPAGAWGSAQADWYEAAIRQLGERLAHSTLLAVREAANSDRAGAFEKLSSPVAVGVGDTTFGLDEGPERIVAAWADTLACRAPLSILTEDSGWRHLGPAEPDSNAWQELPSFDHGGPRLAIDPVDGTRNLMFDLRSAWASIAMAAPGPSAPHLSEVCLGYLRELPDSRAGRARLIIGKPVSGECTIELLDLMQTPAASLGKRPLSTDEHARVSGGFFPFFRYHPDMREALAGIEADFFALLEEHEGATLRDIYDDQYISNAGQLLALAQSKYRMIADLRAHIAHLRGRGSVTSKPYDVAAAIPIARAAGAIVTAPSGEELDFELNAQSPISFVGWANSETAKRLAPHLQASLQKAKELLRPDPEPDQTS